MDNIVLVAKIFMRWAIDNYKKSRTKYQSCFSISVLFHLSKLIPPAAFSSRKRLAKVLRCAVSRLPDIGLMMNSSAPASSVCSSMPGLFVFDSTRIGVLHMDLNFLQMLSRSSCDMDAEITKTSASKCRRTFSPCSKDFATWS